MSYTIVNIKTAQALIGIEFKIAVDPEAGLLIQDALWNQFEKSGLADMQESAIGLYYDYEESDGSYMFAACIQTDDASNATHVIPPGVYAQFTTHRTIGKLWEEIERTDLDRLYTNDFEVYYKDGASTIEVYVAIKDTNPEAEISEPC